MFLSTAGLIKAPLGETKTGPNPTDRGRCGSKYHVMTSEAGHVLTVTLTEANMHDLRQLLRLVFVEFPHVGGLPGRPLDRPMSVRADKGYDCEDDA